MRKGIRDFMEPLKGDLRLDLRILLVPNKDGLHKNLYPQEQIEV